MGAYLKESSKGLYKSIRRVNKSSHGDFEFIRKTLYY